MTSKVERMLPLYEAKMIHHFDHRWSTYERDGQVRDVTEEEKQDPEFHAQPRYWVRQELVSDRVKENDPEVGRADWFAGYRWVTNVTNERTFISTALPLAGAGNSLPVFRKLRSGAVFLGVVSSFVFDFCARQKLGGQNMTFGTVYQLPVPLPQALGTPAAWAGDQSSAAWIELRVTALNTCWSSSRQRRLLRSELDAACFHLYALEREDVEYIMDTFPIVKRKDEAKFGSYRTKEEILTIYDAMQVAIDSGGRYESPLEDLLAEMVDEA